MMHRTVFSMVLLFITLGMGAPATMAQQTPSSSMSHGDAQLTESGSPIFAAVQEVIRTLEADSATDWSTVNLEALRQHLIDMHNVAVHVDVVMQLPVDEGVRLRVRPENAEARASLRRVLRAHAEPLQQETGWTMEVESMGEDYEVTVTSSEPADVEKIRALGYIGLLAYGMHHRQHHLEIATGQ